MTQITATEEDIKNALHHVIDPEIGINIVDLGLVYKVAVHDKNIQILMTMTSPSCPLGLYLQGNVESAIREKFPYFQSIDVQLVWDPPWIPEMMSDAAKRQLGWKEES
ncbi:MAG: metal-sulfur cluster assembly factor [Nitrospinae bacterium]|nr:metal-sulfur cluster assembly factor [Nitrospinota bacterium]